MRVPSMAMHDFGTDPLSVEGQASGERPQRRDQRNRAARELAAIDLRPSNGELAVAED